MASRALKRGFLMIAGILSVVVIVLTQSFYQTADGFQRKAKTEQAEKNNQEVFIQVPADAVPHGNTVAVSENIPSVAEKTETAEAPQKTAVVVKKVFVSFFQTLFRVIIAPNAP